MNSREEKDQALRSHPQGALESPFLEEEFFVGETKAEWEGHIAALEGESPFQRAFQQDRTSLIEPDELHESSAAPQPFVGEEQYESLDTESRPERVAQRPEPSAEEEGSAETEYFHDVLESSQDEEIDMQLESPSDLSPGIAEALRNSDWARALKLAIEEGCRDENKLTNLIFFARHSELAGGKLDSKHPKFKQLSREWITIRDREVWPAILKSAENTSLAVSGKDVAADHRQFWGKTGKRFKSLIEDAAKQVELNPGLLAANLLAETGTRNSYLTKDKVDSYHIGVDDFYERQHAIAQRVPAYAKIGWDRKQKPVEHDNDAKKPRLVKTIKFDSGPDALLASAVYLKYGEVRLREEATKLGGNFDKLPLEMRWALIRMAFNAGVGGAAKRLAKALKGEDILVRKNIPRKAYQTERNATIHTARALHISDWIFGVSMRPSIQPESESPEVFDEEDDESYDFDTELDEEGLGDEAEDDIPTDEITELDAEDGGEHDVEEGRLFEELVPKVSQADLRRRIDEYFDLANAEYTLPNGTKAKAKAWPQFRYAKGTPPPDKAKVRLKHVLGAAFYGRHRMIIHMAVYGRAKPSEIALITQGLIDAGELDAAGKSNPRLSDGQLVRKLQRKFGIGIDCAGYVQMAFIYAFTGSDDDPSTRKESLGPKGKKRESFGLKAWRGNENLGYLDAKHFTEVGFLNGQTGDLFVLKPKAGDWHTMIVVDRTSSGTEHTFLVDASWGTDTYGEKYAGVARRELVYDSDSATKEWWDISPGKVEPNETIYGIGFKAGEKAYPNNIGPYNGHHIKGMYRAKQKK